MTTYVEVFPANGIWNVRFTSEPEKSRVQRMMGTNEIPTPFSTELEFDDVFKALRTIPANAQTCFVEAGR